MSIFLFVEMSMQVCYLQELAAFLREKMLSAAALKQYVSHVHCAAYLDFEAHRHSRAQLEKAWPAYADDLTPLACAALIPEFVGGLT